MVWLLPTLLDSEVSMAMELAQQKGTPGCGCWLHRWRVAEECQSGGNRKCKYYRWGVKQTPFERIKMTVTED